MKFVGARISLLLVCALLVSCAVPAGRSVPSGAPLSVDPTGPLPTIGLGPLQAQLDPNLAKWEVQYSWFCKPVGPTQLSADRLPVPRGDVQRAFQNVLGPLGYRLAPAQTSVFEAPVIPDLVLGGTLTQIEMTACYPYTGSPYLDVGNPTVAKGHAFLEVRWEIYSVQRKEVVFRSTVQSAFDTTDAVKGGSATLIQSAVTENLKNLAAQPGFREAILRHKP